MRGPLRPFTEPSAAPGEWERGFRWTDCPISNGICQLGAKRGAGDPGYRGNVVPG